MNTIGKNGVKVVERHLVTQELSDEMKARLEVVENRQPEVRREEMTDTLHRVALLEKQVGHLQRDTTERHEALTHDTANLFGIVERLSDRVVKIDAKPAQVILSTTVEKPGVTVHENVLLPCTSSTVWWILGALGLIQAAQLWRLLP